MCVCVHVLLSSSLCERGEALACPAGDLSAKHGPLTVSAISEIRIVLTDPYLPLSGPNSGNCLHVAIL